MNLNLDEYVTALLASCFTQESAKASHINLLCRHSRAVCPVPVLLRPLGFSPRARYLHGSARDASTCATTLSPRLRPPFCSARVVRFTACTRWSQPDRTSFYVWDFGDYVGNFLKEVDKAFYFRILNDKAYLF